MKLYLFTSGGQSPYSYAVAADCEEQAREAVGELVRINDEREKWIGTSSPAADDWRWIPYSVRAVPVGVAVRV